jgi:hypothetical protein
MKSCSWCFSEKRGLEAQTGATPDFDLDGDQANVTVSSVQAFISWLSASQRFSNRIETTRRDSWTNTGLGWCLSRSERQAIKSWIDGKLDRETTFESPLKAALAMARIAVLLREPKREQSQQQDRGFDVIGFILVATFLGALEIVLDRGLEDDWFASTFIVTFSVVCAVAFVLMIPWEMSRRNPMIDLRMVATRQFGGCFLVMLATGAVAGFLASASVARSSGKIPPEMPANRGHLAFGCLTFLAEMRKNAAKISD